MAAVPFTKPLLAALIAAAAGACAAQAPAAPDVARHQAQIDKIVGDMSPQRIEAHVRKLVGFKTRHTMSDTVSDTAASAPRGAGSRPSWNAAAPLPAGVCR
ncbi:hypothetical protein [Massilia antarctica]|uniref:hypothetical protein n=1 Tax=Massilia antarctica TaxID=2765360 RepID=UPI0006BB811D|nr:hypothetical protein [Massilia sp. H27-R4]MCY0914822.1 hypothetical protein [Massilia sp. H27-R4]CUI08132.1 hypothetical protein BN2497_11041 [Janthinobacterium sp. CG23_2]CUU31918.1 hypothetical protein BN3177_11041 [Janthinobacterium sp. CG23_2]